MGLEREEGGRALPPQISTKSIWGVMVPLTEMWGSLEEEQLEQGGRGMMMPALEMLSFKVPVSYPGKIPRETFALNALIFIDDLYPVLC